ncbi:MAG TPA: nucleotidyltransferase [Solirubrobacteraceae bacterium]|nr:nucleotidyltransferase [Solirubrobacteraceae bacterium]
MPDDEERFGPILATLRKSVALLREAEIPFLVGGSLAAWARGGPEVTNDLDLMVRPADAERALALLVEAGMRPERPPEEWLLKAWDGDVLVDLIFITVEGEVTDEVIARGEELTVTSVAMNVLRLEDMFALRLQTLNEHYLDYAALLKMARALREQVDWDAVRGRVRHTPYGRAFFTMLEGLDVVPAPEGAGGTAAGADVEVRPVDVGRRTQVAFGPAGDATH